MTSRGVRALQFPEASAVLWSSPQHPTAPSLILRAVAQEGGIFLHLHEETHCCLNAHPSSFSCCSAMLISSFCIKSEVSRVWESNKVMHMCVSVSGGINTICSPLLQFLSWASERLNRLRSL